MASDREGSKGDLTVAGGSRVGVAAAVDRRAAARRIALRGLGISAGIALVSSFGVAFHIAFFGVALGAGLGGLGSFLALVSASAGAGPRLFHQEVTIEGRAVRLRNPWGRAFPLDDVVQGWKEDPDLVHLALRSGDVLVVRAASAADGDRLLHAAGVSASARVLRVPLASAASQIPGGSFFGGVVLALFGGGLFLAFATLAYRAAQVPLSAQAVDVDAFSVWVTTASLLGFGIYALASALRRREVVVGTDGIAYRNTFHTEFIPYGNLRFLRPDTRGVRLVLKDGRRLLLPTRRAGERPLPLPLPLARQPPRPKTPAEAQRRMLIDRIGAAMAAGGAPPLAQVALDRLDRHGRTREAWRDDLGKLLAPEGDYRNALVSPEDLGALIEDSSAPAERRVAAALALAARAGDEARRRVRIAVQACADDDLRGALEAAAEGEIEEASLGRAMSRRG